MKRYVLLLIVSSMYFAIYAQDKTDFVYLFDDFQKGTITFKSGNTAEAFFNYELISEKIHFEDNNNNPLELAEPEIVKYIEFGNNTFEHIKGSTFYQKIDLGNIDLYIKHGGSMISKGKPSGYGGYSKTAAIDNVTHVRGAGTYLKLEGDEPFEVEKKIFYYLKIDGKFKQFRSVNSLAKLFKGHEKEIKEAIKDEKTDFKKIEDVTEAIRFCGELLEK